MLKNNYGIFITKELSHLKILLYADYMKWGLAVNMSKTKIIIFRNSAL